MEDQKPEATQPLFRAAKRRKVIRQRQSSLEPEHEPAPQSVQKVLKARTRTGLDVSNASTSIPSQIHPSPAAQESGDLSAPALMSGRFAPQTGLVKDDVDKHMMAYVDSRIAQIRGGPDYSQDDSSSTRNAADANMHHPTKPIARMPAGAGKLQEIDLGPDSTRQNVLRTQAAVFGESKEVDEPINPKKARWKRRQRRTSEDVRRDQMVEAILSEAKLDKYSAPGPAQGPRIADDGADDRIVEEFKREFLDSQQGKGMAAPNPAKKKGDAQDAMLKGPKMGGGRSARQAMYAAMQQKTAGDSTAKR